MPSKKFNKATHNQAPGIISQWRGASKQSRSTIISHVLVYALRAHGAGRSVGYLCWLQVGGVRSKWYRFFQYQLDSTLVCFTLGKSSQKGMNPWDAPNFTYDHPHLRLPRNHGAQQQLKAVACILVCTTRRAPALQLSKASLTRERWICTSSTHSFSREYGMTVLSKSTTKPIVRLRHRAELCHQLQPRTQVRKTFTVCSITRGNHGGWTITLYCPWKLERSLVIESLRVHPFRKNKWRSERVLAAQSSWLVKWHLWSSVVILVNDVASLRGGVAIINAHAFTHFLSGL